MAAATVTEAAIDRRRLADRSFWVALLLAFVVLAAWAVASPHMAAPDEPAHAAKAAATVRGQFAAEEARFRPGRGTFEVPALFQQAWAQPCFAYQPDVPGGCAPEIGGDLETIVPVESHVARYNPVYYALVGLPSLLPLSEHTFTAMRLVGALINALLLALTFRIIAGLRRPLLPMLGLFAALTPMVFFVGASISPQGPEVFGALLVGTGLMALVFDPRREVLVSRAWAVAAGTVFFALARGLSPGYLLLIVALVALAAPRFETLRDIVSDRRVWPPLVVCAAVSVGAVAYTLLSGSLALGIVFPDPALTAQDVIMRMLLDTGAYAEQVIGVFGWGDVRLPLAILAALGGVVLIVVALGFRFASWRGRIVLALLLAASVVVPIAVQLMSFRESGLVWQGRYVMPLVLQAPLLAGFLAGTGRMRIRTSAVVLTSAVGVLAIAHSAAVAVNLHRYIAGAGGPWFGVVDGAWQPALPAVVIAGAVAASWIVAAVLVARFAVRASEVDGVIRSAAPDRSDSSVG
ncbi:MAG: DUF2142 domain-containing protein [Microbacterium sp.]